MQKKVLFLWGIILFLFILPLGGGSENVKFDINNTNLVLLKAGPIKTDNSGIIYSEKNDEGPSASITSYSDDAADIDDCLERYYIVQFNGPVLEEWKMELAAAGPVLFDYIPNNAFVVRMDTSQKEQVDSFDFVKWTGEYKASYKHQLDIVTGADMPAISSADSEAELIVLLFDERESEKIREKIVSLGADIVECSGTLLRVNVPRDMIDELASIEGICWIEEYAVPVVFNDIAAEIMNVNPVHNNYRLNGTGQIVAVCDTGLDTGDINTIHEDIRGQIIEIIDYSNDGALDYAGHGTHVTGSLLGNGYLSSGVYKGTAPEAKLIFQAVQKDTDSTTSMSAIPENLSILFQEAYDRMARIHSNSWGDTSKAGEYTAYSQQADQFMWEHPDMLILFAAGNKGVDVKKDGVVDRDSIINPATAKNCITVGASENERNEILKTWGASYEYPINNDYKANNSEGIAAISSRGPTDDNRIKPDLVAPGTYIISVKSTLATFYSSDIVGNDYVYMTGTSMSTPLVAGAAALTRQYYIDIEKLAGPSAALIKATLINGAYDMAPGQYDTGIYQEITGRPDYSQGWGRVDVENSLFPEYPKVIAYYDSEAGLRKSGSWSTEYSYVKGEETLRATLVWTDYPGSPASGKALVNNLDLTATGAGNTYYGNGAPDSTNNVEAVEIKNTVAGSYQFTVTGANVPQGPQPFALVLSFTCDNNVFPAHGSNTSDSRTVVATDVVHPAGVNLSSVSMKVNGSPVSYTNSVINGGYRIQYATSTSFQNGEYNVSVIALTSKGQPFSYGWKFNVAAVPPANNASLSGLVVSKGALYPGFSSAATSYNVSVGHDVETIGVTATLSDPKASMKINGQVASSGIAKTIELQPAGSKTTITIAVTAEDRTTENIYTIIVNRASEPAEEASYLITIAPVIGGTANVTADKSSAKTDETVNVTIAAIEGGKKFSSISVTGNSGDVQASTISSGVSYSFVMPAGNVTVTVALTAEQFTATPTTSGGGGGGGGGSTGEKAENIELKDVSSTFVGKDLVRFDFKNPDNDVQYIEYISLKNAGTITATVEVLKSRSVFAGSPPEGVVYRHINIWLGKTGYATEANIREPRIVFRIDNNWVSSNNIDPASIALNRYADNAWNRLPTEQTGSDADYLYFRATTLGFSPFAITGESLPDEAALHSTSDALFSTDPAESGGDVLDGSATDGNQPEKTLPALSVTVALLIVSFACFLRRKQ